MSEYRPDKFLLIEITLPEEKLVKVFGTWAGGYLNGDSWRLNSGVESIKVEDQLYHFFGSSGSVYICHSESYGATVYGQSVLNNAVEKSSCTRILSEEEMLKYVTN